MPTKTSTKAPMSDEHKGALAEGREQGRTVRRYLEALESNRPKRGRKRSKEAMTKRLEVIEQQLESADPLKRVHMVQERMNLQEQLEADDTVQDMAELEEQFVAVVGPYSERKGITYAAWRQLGVPAQLLDRAGIPKR